MAESVLGFMFLDDRNQDTVRTNSADVRTNLVGRQQKLRCFAAESSNSPDELVLVVASMTGLQACCSVSVPPL
ncbi:hypothetical protein QL285_051364 [Trifolium repens]|nr:hypothetical protein QL285_051364 [Trifolium repens]